MVKPQRCYANEEEEQEDLGRLRLMGQKCIKESMGRIYMARLDTIPSMVMMVTQLLFVFRLLEN